MEKENADNEGQAYKTIINKVKFCMQKLKKNYLENQRIAINIANFMDATIVWYKSSAQHFKFW